VKKQQQKKKRHPPALLGASKEKEEEEKEEAHTLAPKKLGLQSVAPGKRNGHGKRKTAIYYGRVC